MTQPSEPLTAAGRAANTAALLIPLGQGNWLRFDPLDDEEIAAIVARLDADYAKADLAGRYAQAWLDVARLVSTMAAYAAILNLQLPGVEAAVPDPVASPLDPRRWPTVDDAVEALAAEIFTEIPRALPWSGAAKMAKENCRDQARQRFGEVAGLLNAESRTVREYVQSLWPVASPAPLDVERLARAMTQAHLYPQPRNEPFGADTPYDMAASIAAAYALEGQPVAEEPR